MDSAGSICNKTLFFQADGRREKGIGRARMEGSLVQDFFSALFWVRFYGMLRWAVKYGDLKGTWKGYFKGISQCVNPVALFSLMKWSGKLSSWRYFGWCWQRCPLNFGHTLGLHHVSKDNMVSLLLCPWQKCNFSDLFAFSRSMREPVVSCCRQFAWQNCLLSSWLVVGWAEVKEVTSWKVTWDSFKPMVLEEVDVVNHQ